MPNPTISRRNDSGGELSSEINAFVQELVAKKLGWTITSTKRGDPGSRHHSFDAMDVGVRDSDDASMLQFFFGEDFDPSDYSNMGSIKMTDKGLAFCKRHNIRILDERNASGAHFHFEAVTEDTADNVVESEDEATYHTEGRLVTIHGTNAYEYGIQVVKNEHTYVKNDYNKSEEYQNSVKDGENVNLTAMTEGGGSSGDVNWVNTNETILNNESKEDEIASEEQVVVEEEVVSEEEVVVDKETSLPKLEYKVQVGVWEGEGLNEKTQSLFNRLREDEGYTVIKELDKGILYKYSLYKVEDGPATTKEAADKLQEELRNFGFEDAFIYAEKDGERIRDEDAAKLESSIRIENMSNTGGVNYRVKVGVFEENVNEKTQAVFDKIEESGEYVIKKELDKGILYSYIAERKDGANTLEDAESIKKAMNDAGIEDAFIYAEDKSGNRINMGEAAEAQKKYNEKKKEEEVDEKDLEGDIDEDEVEDKERDIEDNVEVAEEVESEFMAIEYGDDEETIRKKLLNNTPELANNPEKLKEDVEWELEVQEDKKQEIETLEKNKEYIDEIFAENPEIAAKYEGVPIEKYSDVEGFWDEIYEPMGEKEEVALENQRQVNKEDTGVLETNEERTKRESDTARFNELEEKKNNNTITVEEQTELTNLMYSYGNNDLNELHESNRVEQAEKDVNIEAGKGDVTDYDIEQQELEEIELESEREENLKTTGIRETNDEKYDRKENEKDANEEKGLGRITDIQAEDENVIWSTPDSEKELRNELKQKLETQESQIRAAAGDDEKIAELEEQSETTKLALEYLELKKQHGREDDVFDIKTLREAVENNDVQQLNMFYNDQRKEALGKLEKDRKAIEDGTFEGTNEARDKILTTLETLKKSEQKSELPTEYTDEEGVITGTKKLKWEDDPTRGKGSKKISGESRASRELIYITNIDAGDEQINQLNALLKDKDFINNGNKNNLAILANAEKDKAASGHTSVPPAGGLSGSGMTVIRDWNTGIDYYVSNNWLTADISAEAKKLKKKQEKGTITPTETENLKVLMQNAPYMRQTTQEEIFARSTGEY